MLNNYKLKSIFKNEINDFINYKKSSGFKYFNQTYILYHMDMNLYNLNLTRKSITKKTFYSLVKRNGRSYENYACHYRVIVDFCKYLILNNYKNIYYKNQKFKHKTNYTNITFNDDEINILFKTMDEYKNNYKASFYKLYYTYAVLFRLIYACGLRASEALNIMIKDVNFNEKIINIMDSKNHKSRIVLFSESMYKCLLTYINLFDIKDGYLFSNRKNNKICYQSILVYYKNIINLAKLNPKSKIHSLRHTFVNKSLRQMIEKGYDENVIIVYLYKYLGHKSIKETEYYIHFTDTTRNKIINDNNKFSKKLYEGIVLNYEK